jgi:hypothetical protein
MTPKHHIARATLDEYSGVVVVAVSDCRKIPSGLVSEVNFGKKKSQKTQPKMAKIR